MFGCITMDNVRETKVDYDPDETTASITFIEDLSTKIVVEMPYMVAHELMRQIEDI